MSPNAAIERARKALSGYDHIVDIAAHWVASEAGHRPGTLAELFDTLRTRGLIDAKLAGHLSVTPWFLWTACLG